MSSTFARRLVHASLFTLSLSLAPSAVAQWTAPTPEELSMTSQKEVPGAAAVYLNREESTEDHLHMFSVYVRLKVLSERGKEYGNVELKYGKGARSGGQNVSDIAGRTIHPDGTIIPFTGKPYEKLIVKGQDVRYMAKVFSMPDVEVGSIVEYRYKLRYDDFYFISPDWFIQSELFTRKAHYRWKPTNKTLVTNDDRGQLSSTIAWTPILPEGAAVKQTMLPGQGGSDEQAVLDLDVHDIPPAPEEEHMPPLSSFTYRVLFYYSPYRNAADFWKNEGKYWSKKSDKFIGPGNGVRAAVQELTAPTDTPDQKLRKLYAAVQNLENTDFTRERSAAEEKSQGFSQLHTTDDVWARKRGSGDQLAELFVAMARAAGMKAYLMTVTNRDRNLFYGNYLSTRQLDDDLAVVSVDGKEVYFDPGSRFCPYQHLAWKHTLAGGIRQVDGGANLASTPDEPYAASRVQRIANLTLELDGTVAGTVKTVYTGPPALRWRQASLEGDDASLRRDLRTRMENMLPGGMEVKIDSIEKLTEYEQPLVVNFAVKGRPGTATGKRLLLPGELFEANSKPMFTHTTRLTNVYFEYANILQDAVRINFPVGFSVESLPEGAKLKLSDRAAFNLTFESTPTSVTVRRTFALGGILYTPKDYPDLRAFYSGVETKDQQSFVLKQPAAAAANSAGN